MILCIETATQSCSVVLENKGEILSKRESVEQNNHSSNITIFIDEVLREAGIKFADLDAVAVSMGPGSYTGLRIGVSTAKGICYAASKPLIAIDTLESIATSAAPRINLCGTDLICPMIDARRMEVYASMFDANLQKTADTKAIVLDGHSFDEFTTKHKVKLVGDGADKCADLYKNTENVEVYAGIRTSATGMVAAAERFLKEEKFADVAYFEPFYLKDFVAGIPKVKALR